MSITAEPILILDDEEAIRQSLADTLQSAGYSVEQASSVQAAIATLATKRWSLILTDLLMPGTNGFSLLDYVRRSHRDVPVVMVTGVHDISVALEAIRMGAYDYLPKPFQREQLLAVVARALEKRRLELENLAYKNELESLVKARTDLLDGAMGDLKRALADRERAMAELERSYDITLEALGNALDLKDAETEGHSKRVTAFTMAIAHALGLTDQVRKVIGRGAFLHDIGKMAIPDAILRKPGRLTPEEQAIMREHCLLGYQMLRKIPFLHEPAEIVYSHQEHFDGSGYPRGLRGEQIHLGARVFAVADAFDAITSDRPYRAAQSMPSALREIEKHSGTQFDPNVVNVFLSISTEFWIKLRDQISDGGRGKRARTRHFSSTIN
ncbi:MAG: HD domain-containing phosphohydrolase [Candidatus Korobacteraceae bacterium]